jgi:6-phosphogluconolactonase
VNIEVFSDGNSISRKAAAMIAADARAAVCSRGRFIMAVSGGRTPWLMLRALACEQLPWENVHVVQVDERIVPACDPDRNLAHIRESLLEHAPILSGHLHAMPVEVPDLSRAAQEYAATLQSVAGLPPVLDFIHLGLGADGQTASLVPRSSPRRHRRRRRSDALLPMEAPNDIDLSNQQSGPPHPMAGNRHREGASTRAPMERGSIHSGVSCASGSGADIL